jgi:hypothetical protein
MVAHLTHCRAFLELNGLGGTRPAARVVAVLDRMRRLDSSRTPYGYWAADVSGALVETWDVVRQVCDDYAYPYRWQGSNAKWGRQG